MWNIFLCLLILTSSVCFYEIRWNCYLSQSWRHVLVWECPYAVCMCLVTLMGELDLMRALLSVASSKVHWFLPPWWGMGPGMEPELGMSGSLSHGVMALTALVRSRAGVRKARAKAPCGMGSALGWSWQTTQIIRQFSICCSVLRLRVSKSVHCLQDHSLGVP